MKRIPAKYMTQVNDTQPSDCRSRRQSTRKSRRRVHVSRLAHDRGNIAMKSFVERFGKTPMAVLSADRTLDRRRTIRRAQADFSASRAKGPAARQLDLRAFHVVDRVKSTYFGVSFRNPGGQYGRPLPRQNPHRSYRQPGSSRRNSKKFSPVSTAAKRRKEELSKAQDDAIRDVIQKQEVHGFPVVTDGEFRRHSFQESFSECVTGFDVPKNIALYYEKRDLNENPLERAEQNFEEAGPAIITRRGAVERLKLVRNLPLEGIPLRPKRRQSSGQSHRARP